MAANSEDEYDFLEKEEEEEEEIDFSNWKVASLDEAEAILRNKDTLEEEIVPIDFENELVIKLYIKELPVNEQLRLLETFMTFDKKTGDAKLKWLPYYAAVYTKMVKKTEPHITWKQARFYNKIFMRILMKYLPNPMEMTGDDVSGIPEQQRKNS